MKVRQHKKHVSKKQHNRTIPSPSWKDYHFDTSGLPPDNVEVVGAIKGVKYVPSDVSTPQTIRLLEPNILYAPPAELQRNPINPILKGVDPYSPDLTVDQKLAIVQECKVNPAYFLAQVVRERIEQDLIDRVRSGGEGRTFNETLLASLQDSSKYPEAVLTRETPAMNPGETEKNIQPLHPLEFGNMAWKPDTRVSDPNALYYTRTTPADAKSAHTHTVELDPEGVKIVPKDKIYFPTLDENGDRPSTAKAVKAGLMSAFLEKYENKSSFQPTAAVVDASRKEGVIRRFFSKLVDSIFGGKKNA